MGEPSTSTAMRPSSILAQRISGFSVVPRLLEQRARPFGEEFGDIGRVGHAVDIGGADALFRLFHHPLVGNAFEVGDGHRRAAAPPRFQHHEHQVRRLEAAADEAHIRLDVFDEPLARALDGDGSLRLADRPQGHLFGAEDDIPLHPADDEGGVARQNFARTGGGVVRFAKFGEEQHALCLLARAGRGALGERPRRQHAHKLFVGDAVRIHRRARGAVPRRKFVYEDIGRRQQPLDLFDLCLHIGGTGCFFF